MAAPPRPKDLGEHGALLWRRIAGSKSGYELRADELRMLEDACREADLIGMLQDALTAETMTVKGSMGQPVVNPIVAELRQHRAVLRQLLVSLKLPDEDAKGDTGDKTKKSALGAAAARWTPKASVT